MKDLLNTHPALTTLKNKHIQDYTVPDALPIGDPFERPCHMRRRSEANTKELTEVTGSLVFLPGTPTAMQSMRRACKDTTPLETLPIVGDPSFEVEAGEREREIERARRMESEKDGERNREREKKCF